jgi:hypothetical protein
LRDERRPLRLVCGNEVAELGWGGGLQVDRPALELGAQGGVGEGGGEAVPEVFEIRKIQLS